MTWIYNNQPLTEAPEGYIGFIYEIENLANGKRYVGKKLFRFQRTRKTKGKRIKKILDSDWKSYYSSSNDLKEDVKVFGEENFIRKVLRFCKTKGEMTYYESKEIFVRDAILDETYYNQWVSCKVARSHLPK